MKFKFKEANTLERHIERLIVMAKAEHCVRGVGVEDASDIPLTTTGQLHEAVRRSIVSMFKERFRVPSYWIMNLGNGDLAVVEARWRDHDEKCFALAVVRAIMLDVKAILYSNAIECWLRKIGLDGEQQGERKECVSIFTFDRECCRAATSYEIMRPKFQNPYLNDVGADLSLAELKTFAGVGESLLVDPLDMGAVSTMH